MNPSENSNFPSKALLVGTLLGGIGIVVFGVAALGFLTVKSLSSGGNSSAATAINMGTQGLFGSEDSKPIFFPDKGDIAIVNVSGVIMRARPFLDRIEELGNKKDLKAVVVRIDSPGGAVGPSQEMLEGLKELQKKVKVVCSFGDIAASGGYYIAAGCEKIVANPGTLTGSIGVIMSLVNLKGLYDWAKIQPQTLKAGKFKDMGSETRALSDDEKKLFQNLLDQVHRQFQNAVKEARKMTQEKVETYCDGRVFTGEEAFNLGFVDVLGGEKTAIEEAAKLAELKDKPKVIREEKVRSMRFPFFGGGGLPWPGDSEESEEGHSQSAQAGFSTHDILKSLKSGLPFGKSFYLKPGMPYFLPSFFLSEGVWSR
jgi:protease-4